jgi:hypothetical protein
MSETSRRSHLKVGHLLGVVAVSAFVLALLRFPQVYALPLVSVAGFVVIATCVVAAFVGRS